MNDNSATLKLKQYKLKKLFSSFLKQNNKFGIFLSSYQYKERFIRETNRILPNISSIRGWYYISEISHLCYRTFSNDKETLEENTERKKYSQLWRIFLYHNISEFADIVECDETIIANRLKFSLNANYHDKEIDELIANLN